MSPSFTRMNFALNLAVAALSLNAASVFETLPFAHVAVWMLFVCSAPPMSDLFDAPERNFLSVVSLFPNASRNANGNSAASNGSRGGPIGSSGRFRLTGRHFLFYICSTRSWR